MAEPASGPTPTRPSRKTMGLAAGGFCAVVLIVATVFSCTRSEPELRKADSRPTTTSSTSTTETVSESSATTRGEPRATTPTTAPDLRAQRPRTSRVATARAGLDTITVYSGASGGDVASSISAAGDYGQRQVFLVIEEEGDRLNVHLPVKPNGTRGWIRKRDVDVTVHDYQIQVSLSKFRMFVQKGSRVIIDTPIGVGTQDTPTVGGDFYTWVLLDPTNGGYGSYAYGLSGFSTLESFGGGDGRMGIHGTTDESSIGRTVSHGCVRVPDDIVVQMVEGVGLPLGVPVTIRA